MFQLHSDHYREEISSSLRDAAKVVTPWLDMWEQIFMTKKFMIFYIETRKIFKYSFLFALQNIIVTHWELQINKSFLTNHLNLLNPYNNSLSENNWKRSKHYWEFKNYMYLMSITKFPMIARLAETGSHFVTNICSQLCHKRRTINVHFRIEIFP